jgi:hypothetical protein
MDSMHMTSAATLVYNSYKLEFVGIGQFIITEYDDECVTASEIYSCGREKEAGIVDVIFNAEKGNATVVRTGGYTPYQGVFIVQFNLISFQYNPPLPCVPFPRIPCQFTKMSPPCVLNVIFTDLFRLVHSPDCDMFVLTGSIKR